MVEKPNWVDQYMAEKDIDTEITGNFFFFKWNVPVVVGDKVGLKEALTFLFSLIRNQSMFGHLDQWFMAENLKAQWVRGSQLSEK